MNLVEPVHASSTERKQNSPGGSRGDVNNDECENEGRCGLGSQLCTVMIRLYVLRLLNGKRNPGQNHAHQENC